MDKLKNLVGVEKIETMFAENIELPSIERDEDKRSFLKKVKIKHLFWIPSLIMNRTYQLMPSILKDIFFCFSITHKSPSSKIFARTRYDELRTMLDIKISALATKVAPINISSALENTFISGFHTTHVSNLSELDSLIDDVMKNQNPSHAGARAYFKDGSNKKIEGSYSAYYTFSNDDNKKINALFDKSLGSDFNYHLSALAGYKCGLKDMSYSLAITYGENSNSEMHQDTYASVAKGFVYLQDVDAGNSPFEYLERSYIEAGFRSKHTNEAVLSNDFHSSGSTRLRGQKLDDSVGKFHLKSFTGPKGLFVLANTAGYHRKGTHDSDKPRIMLACGVKRKGLVTKFLINFFEIIRPSKNVKRV